MLTDSSTPAVLTGRHGEYAVLEERGRGAFGVTYRGRRLADDLPVALKVLRLDRLGNWNAFDLFERESAVLQNLAHPGVPAWLDHFVLGEPEAPTGFVLVQAFIEGRALAEVMRTPGALSSDEMLGWFEELLGVLEYLHCRVPPVIHRDVTPGNVILRAQGGAALVDFGSVQAAMEREGSIAMTSAGTFGYAAPEQFLGRSTSASDLHGAAMTFLAVWSGRQPSRMPLLGVRVDVGALLGDQMPPLRRLLEEMTTTDPRERLADASVARRRVAQLRRTGALTVQGASTPLAAPASQAMTSTARVPARAGTTIGDLRTRLARAGFIVEEGGQIEHTLLAFRARRPARRLARLPAIQVYATSAEALDGHPGTGPVRAPAVSLFARAAGELHRHERSWVDALCGTPPRTVVALIASDEPMAPHAAARVEAALFGPGPPVLVAVLCSGGGVEMMAPVTAWGQASAAVRAHLVQLLGDVPSLARSSEDWG